MGRNAILVVLAAYIILGGAIFIAQSGRPVTTETVSRNEAPGTTVKTDRDRTRVQAPGVNNILPRGKDGD